jgi:hypothetical protein
MFEQWLPRLLVFQTSNIILNSAKPPLPVLMPFGLQKSSSGGCRVPGSTCVTHDGGADRDGLTVCLEVLVPSKTSWPCHLLSCGQWWLGAHETVVGQCHLGGQKWVQLEVALSDSQSWHPVGGPGGSWSHWRKSSSSLCEDRSDFPSGLEILSFH